MAQQCTLPRCRHCQRLRTAAGIVPVDTSFDGWVVLRGLVEELASAADPCDALTVLAELSADEPPGCGQAGRTAIARTPGAVAAILGATSHRGPSNVDTARVLLASIILAEPAMCGPAIQGDVAAPIVDRLIAWLEDEEREQYADVFCLALLSIAKCRSWATPYCAQTTPPGEGEEHEDEYDDNASSEGAGADEPATRVRADGLEVVDDATFERYVSRPLGAVLRFCDDAETRSKVFRALALLQIDRDGPRAAQLGCRRVHGRVEALVGVGVPRALGEALGKGHGDDEEGPDREAFTLAAQSVDNLLASKIAFAPLVAAGVIAPLARAFVFAAGNLPVSSAVDVDEAEEDLLFDAGDALCSIAHFTHCTALNEPEPPENLGCLAAMLDAGVAEACVAVLPHGPTMYAKGVAAKLLSNLATCAGGATRVAAAGGIPKLVAFLIRDEFHDAGDPDPVAHESYLAAARAVERLAGSDVREAGAEARADALVAAGAIRKLKQDVEAAATELVSGTRETWERAHLAANALGNFAEHSAARARAVAGWADDDSESDDDDMDLITALIRCLGRGPTGPDAPAELLEMKTAVAWCFASLAGTEDLAAHLYDAGAHVLFATLLVVVKDEAPLPASPDRVHTPGDIRAYLAMALGRLAGSGADRAAAIAKLPGLVTALRDLASDDVPDTAREARDALEALGRDARTLPRRKCRKVVV